MSNTGPRGRIAERRLFDAYRRTADPRARDALVERYMPLARSLARRYHGSAVPLEDLEQVAYLALVRAVDGFDATRGLAFSSYAVPSIAGAIKRHFRDHGWAVRVPRDLQELALRVERTSNDLLGQTGRSPTANEVARHVGTGAEDVLEAREAHRSLYSESIDQPRRDRDGEDARFLHDTLGEPDPGIDAVLERATLGTLLDTLDDRARTIVVLYYHGGLTQSEIGRRVGLSQMHVSRLLRDAIDQLRLAAAREHKPRPHTEETASHAARARAVTHEPPRHPDDSLVGLLR